MTSNTWCPQNTTEIYEHVYYGHDSGCDCLDICGRDMSGCYAMHVGTYCTYNQTKYGCREYGGFPAIRQGQFDGKRICGQRGGAAFLNATRPD